jgi:hypothetical protein
MPASMGTTTRDLIMQQVVQVHNQYLIDVQIILAAALLNKPHFFKATNDFEAERAQLVKEQAQDLGWWVLEQMTEEQYFNQLAEIHG